MERNSYRTIEYGGKHRGSVSYLPTSDELVLDRADIAYVMKALRRGSEQDRAFARRMFNTLCPATHCESCGRRILDDDNLRRHRGKTLCDRCWQAFTDIEYCLEWEDDLLSKPNPNSPNALAALKSLQKNREDWCKADINYLIDETTYDEWLRKYNAVFAKDNNNQQEGECEK